MTSWADGSSPVSDGEASEAVREPASEVTVKKMQRALKDIAQVLGELRAIQAEEHRQARNLRTFLWVIWLWLPVAIGIVAGVVVGIIAVTH